MNGSSAWIEPPPPQRGLGCFAKGCLILVIFFILLALAFVAGTYYAAKYLRTEYFSSSHERLPISRATVEDEEAVRARWDGFEKSAKAHEAARIELRVADRVSMAALRVAEARAGTDLWEAVLAVPAPARGPTRALPRSDDQPSPLARQSAFLGSHCR